MARPPLSQWDNLAEGHRQWARHYSEAGAAGLTAFSSAAVVASRLHAGVEESLSPFGVSLAQFELLTLLMWSSKGGLAMSDISHRLHTPPASLTHMVRTLESMGLVDRHRDSHDKRSFLVSITDQGIALATSAGPVLNAHFESLDFSPEEIELLAELARDS